MDVIDKLLQYSHNFTLLYVEDHIGGKLEASNTNNGAIFHITLTKKEVE